MKRSGQQRKHPRKTQARLDARVSAFERQHVSLMEKGHAGMYTRPGSRKK